MAQRAGNAKYGDGFPVADIRIGQQGDLLASTLHGDFYEQAVRKNLFFSTSLARATSLVGTAMVGNLIWNPPDSGVNIVLVKWHSAIIATSATCTGIVLAAGYQSTPPTTLTVVDSTGTTYLQLSGATNSNLPTPRGQAYAAATVLFAPKVIWYLHHNTAAIATTGVDEMVGYLEGAFVIPPGGFVCMAAQGAAAAAAAHSSSIMWEEVPVI